MQLPHAPAISKLQHRIVASVWTAGNQMFKATQCRPGQQFHHHIPSSKGRNMALGRQSGK
jgi:hypothetical protein